MKFHAMVVLVAIALGAPSVTLAQHQGTPAKRIGHSLFHPIQKAHHPLLHHGGGCDSCGAVGACHSGCRPCCPPVIPAILNGLDRLVHCLIPCHGRVCGGCHSCAGRVYNGCGCGSCGGAGVVYDGVIVDQKDAPQATPAPASQSYYDRRGVQTPRYQQTRSVAPQPIPARRTSAPQPRKRPVSDSRVRTASAELAPVDAKQVQLQPAPRTEVRSATIAAPVPSKNSRSRNPLR